jgi:outer membrane protein TolC
MENNLNVVKQQLAQGTAINADLLSSQMRRDQADIDLGNAKTIQQKAFLNLASLVSESEDAAALKDPVSLYKLGTKPDAEPEMAAPSQPLAGAIDTDALINSALLHRPEIRAAALSVSAAEHSKRLAEAPLYPTLNLNGNYTYADPNQRVAFQSDPNTFTGTWTLGASLSWDLGGIPANVAEVKAQNNGIQKSLSDSSRQKEVILLDVRNSILSYEQTRRDAGLVTLMLDQAKENERVMKERYNAGTASANDLLGASLARLRSEFTITNKQIDLQIAASDLCRAAALSGDK